MILPADPEPREPVDPVDPHAPLKEGPKGSDVPNGRTYLEGPAVLHARTWAEIDLLALERNLKRVREAAGPAAIMLVVKADAYGHGAVPVSWHLLSRGVSALGVGDSAEALALRAAGITAPILILGAIVPGEMEDVIRGGISVTVHSSQRVRALARAAERMGAIVKVHLKVDTGMGRLGCAPGRAASIAREIERSKNLDLDGIATHLASPGPDGVKDTERQLARFRRVIEDLRRDGIEPPWRHALSSGGIVSLPSGEFNLVRPGLAVYGLSPVAAGGNVFEPALSWKTQIVFLRDHRKGARIGYGGTWRAPAACRIATLPLGYNDGYRFSFSNRAHVLVRGARAPVVGRVSMDYVMVDVTHIPGVRVDDEVTLVGRDGAERVGIEELARWADTIPYEILCGIGRRVLRTYRSGSPVGVPADGNATAARAPAAAAAGWASEGTAAPPEAPGTPA